MYSNHHHHHNHHNGQHQQQQQHQYHYGIIGEGPDATIAAYGSSVAMGIPDEDQVQKAWTCSICTFHNSESLGRFCSMCGSARFGGDAGEEASESSYTTTTEHGDTLGELAVLPMASSSNQHQHQHHYNKHNSNDNFDFDAPTGFSPSRSPNRYSHNNNNNNDLEASFSLLNLMGGPSLDEIPETKEATESTTNTTTTGPSSSSVLPHRPSEQLNDKDFQMSFANWSISDNGAWTCSICTFVNTNALHLTCEVCGQSRPSTSSKKMGNECQKQMQSMFETSFRSGQTDFLKRQQDKIEEIESRVLAAERYSEIEDMQSHILKSFEDDVDVDVDENNNDDETAAAAAVNNKNPNYDEDDKDDYYDEINETKDDGYDGYNGGYHNGQHDQHQRQQQYDNHRQYNGHDQQQQKQYDDHRHYGGYDQQQKYNNHGQYDVHDQQQKKYDDHHHQQHQYDNRHHGNQQQQRQANHNRNNYGGRRGGGGVHPQGRMNNGGTYRPPPAARAPAPSPFSRQEIEEQYQKSQEYIARLEEIRQKEREEQLKMEAVLETKRRGLGMERTATTRALVNPVPSNAEMARSEEAKVRAQEKLLSQWKTNWKQKETDIAAIRKRQQDIFDRLQNGP